MAPRRDLHVSEQRTWLPLAKKRDEAQKRSGRFGVENMVTLAKKRDEAQKRSGRFAVENMVTTG